jgi:hypothetical protein
MSPKPKKAYQTLNDENNNQHHQIHHAHRHHRHVHHHRNYEGHVHQYQIDDPDCISMPMIACTPCSQNATDDAGSNNNKASSNVNKSDLANKRSHFVRAKSDIKSCTMKVIEFDNNNKCENAGKDDELKPNNSYDSSNNKTLHNTSNNVTNSNLLSASSSVIHRSTPNLNNLNEIISEDLSLGVEAKSSNAKNSLSKYEINYPSNLELSTNLDDLQQRNTIKLDNSASNNTNNGLNNSNNANTSVLGSDKSNLNSTNNKLLINNLLINNNNNIYASTNNKKLTQRYKLIVEGDVHVCKLPNTRNVISKILNSKLLKLDCTRLESILYIY